MHPLDTASFSVRALAGAGAAFLTWIVAADLGGAVVRKLVHALRGSALLACALGYALVGLACGLLGLLHALDLRVIAAVFAITILIRAKSYWYAASDSCRRAAAAWRRLREADLLPKLAAFATVVGVGIAFCAAALPAVWWDPIAYHLPIAALGLARHALGFDAGMAQTGFPLLAESAALPAYALAGTAGAAMATLGAGIVLALLCGELAESLANGAGALATVLVATSALWLWLSPSFYVDVPFALFAIAAFAAPLLAPDRAASGVAVLSGAFAGAAAATKYPGLYVALVAIALVLSYTPRVDRLSGANKVAPLRGAVLGRQLASFAGGFLFIAAGWYARSYLLTGDPFYPFLSAALAIARVAPNQSQHQQDLIQWFHSARPHFCGAGISLGDFVALPWRMLTNPKMFCGDPGYALRLGFVVFAAAPFLFRQLRPAVALTAALTGFWFFTSQQWRLLVDAMALFSVAVAAATMLIQSRVQTIVAGLLVVLCLVGALTQVLPSMLADASNSLVPAYRYMVGGESGQEYLRHRLETYAAAEWLAQHDKDAKVFALDDVRDYYFGTNVAWGNSPYPGGWRLDWSAASQDRYRALIDAGYRYMVVNDNPAYTHRTLTDVNWPALEHDEQVGVLHQVFSENNVTVYEIGRR